MVGEFTRQCPFLFEAGYLCHPIMSEQNPPRAEQEAEGQDGNGLGWFRRMKEGITTKTAEKKEIPEGNWYKCPSCKTVIASQEHEQNLWVCPHCDHHERIGSTEYFSVLFDEGKYRELQAKMTSANPLNFKDTKDYEDRLEASMAKTGLKDAIRTGVGEVGGRQMVISAMDFGFIGGSMGSVVGEKIARAIDYSIKNGLPYVCVTKSGGARMMEAGLSLMQMAKTSARLSLLAKAGLPYVCILTDPTTGGVTASYAMLGDIHLAEPNALIGFAGPRVVKETIGKDLPAGFQRSEFLLEHGFVDRIVHRKNLRTELSTLIGMLTD
jgi:acetyl-CoA carboxylase carboxyl transferase subunit beta